MSRCLFDVHTPPPGCPHEARYEVHTEHSDEPWLLCGDHTAEVRAVDPLGYITSVRSLPRTAA